MYQFRWVQSSAQHMNDRQLEGDRGQAFGRIALLPPCRQAIVKLGEIMRLFLCVALTLIVPLASALARPCAPMVEQLSLELSGTRSRAEILRPPTGRARAVMVLIHGSDVADLDNSIVASGGRIVSTPLRDVAVAMACAGIATIRYDKRFVSGPEKVDRKAFDKLKLQDLLADAGTALDAAGQRPDLAMLPPLVFGWSEGTTIAAALAVQRPEIRAVVLQAPVIDGFAAVLQAQLPRVGVPYMNRYATQGSVDADAVARAGAGPAGVIARIYVHMFAGFAPGQRLNPLLDTNKDGRISIAGEAVPIIADWFGDSADGGLGIYATSVALPGVRAQLPGLRVPVLVLQGEADGNIDAAAARSLTHTRGVTVKLYPRLGHTLGFSASILEDEFAPIAARPLDDMTRWTISQLKRQATTPGRLF